eukprot:Opistho-2@69177
MELGVGRHLNGDGKTLLGNWVEERSVQRSFPPDEPTLNLKTGNRGIVSLDRSWEGNSTARTSYVSPSKDNVRKVGRRRELLEKAALEQACAEEEAARNAVPPQDPLMSITHSDFRKEIPARAPRDPSTRSPLYAQPATFWSEKAGEGAIDGVSMVADGRSPFRKNAAFSTPIEEDKGSIKPHQEATYKTRR